MKWLIEIAFDTEGRAVARMPTITAAPGDEVIWFVQSRHRRPFKVALERIGDTTEIGLADIAALTVDGEDDFGDTRDMDRVLDSHPVQAVRLFVPDGIGNLLAGYRILEGPGNRAPGTAFTGVIAIHGRLSNSLPDERDPRPPI